MICDGLHKQTPEYDCLRGVARELPARWSRFWCLTRQPRSHRSARSAPRPATLQAQAITPISPSLTSLSLHLTYIYKLKLTFTKQTAAKCKKNIIKGKQTPLYEVKFALLYQTLFKVLSNIPQVKRCYQILSNGATFCCPSAGWICWILFCLLFLSAVPCVHQGSLIVRYPALHLPPIFNILQLLTTDNAANKLEPQVD